MGRRAPSLALTVDPQRVARWRHRWVATREKLAAAEAPEVTAEQLAQIIVLACRKPEELGLPVTHWTP